MPCRPSFKPLFTKCASTLSSYRFSRREDDYCVECSTDGENFSQMRICHMYAAADEIQFGIYACSPEESSFTALFSDMKITECAWKAHDGQQPDEE